MIIELLPYVLQFLTLLFSVDPYFNINKFQETKRNNKSIA